LARQNQGFGSLDLIYAIKEPRAFTLETATAAGFRHWRNLDGLNLSSYGQLTNTIVFTNHWRARSQLQYRMPYFDDREVGDGTALERAGLRGFELRVDGDPRGSVSGYVWGVARQRPNGWYFDADASVAIRALPQLDLELLPYVVYTTGEPRFLEEQGADRLLFGRLTAAQFALTARVTYTFAPRLTLQAYCQVFLARGQYSQIMAYDRGADTRPAITLADLRPTDDRPTDHPDFRRASGTGSVVLRWEYALGSFLYVVYTRSQTSKDPVQLGDRVNLDPGRLLNAPAADVFLIKMSYWWGA
jgi:hypothetical protein